jgi:hypothetical protein
MDGDGGLLTPSVGVGKDRLVTEIRTKVSTSVENIPFRFGLKKLHFPSFIQLEGYFIVNPLPLSEHRMVFLSVKDDVVGTITVFLPEVLFEICLAAASSAGGCKIR